jgi:hypothetical protein
MKLWRKWALASAVIVIASAVSDWGWLVCFCG